MKNDAKKDPMRKILKKGWEVDVPVNKPPHLVSGYVEYLECRHVLWYENEPADPRALHRICPDCIDEMKRPIKDRVVEAEQKFRALCERFKVKVPPLRASLSTDPCDFTSPTEVRLNVVAARGADMDYYVAHNFAHYICGIEEESDESGSNKIADLIAGLILEEK